MYFMKPVKKEPKINKVLDAIMKITVIVGVVVAVFLVLKYYCKKHGIKQPFKNFCDCGCHDDDDDICDSCCDDYECDYCCDDVCDCDDEDDECDYADECCGNSCSCEGEDVTVDITDEGDSE